MDFLGSKLFQIICVTRSVHIGILLVIKDTRGIMECYTTPICGQYLNILCGILFRRLELIAGLQAWSRRGGKKSKKFKEGRKRGPNKTWRSQCLILYRPNPVVWINRKLDDWILHQRTEWIENLYIQRFKHIQINAPTCKLG